jgi:hypothetical protein
MTFNDTSTNLGICQEVDDICKTTTASYPVAAKARRANSAMADFTGIALNSDDRWSFDDTNYTDIPIGTTDLVDGQDDYSIDSDFLKVTKVELKDENGDWVELTPYDRNDVKLVLDEEGTPEYYDKFANSIILYPKPDYSQTASLRVSFQRDGSYFTASDTTKEPGIPSLFHKYIALKVAESYLRDNKKENYVSVRNEIQKYEEEKIPEYYSKRNKDERPTISGARINCY